MDQVRWDSLSQGQKAQFILAQEIVVKPQTSIRANAKSNDKDVMVTVYMAFAGSVVLGGQHPTPEAAMMEGAASLVKWRSAAETDFIIHQLEEASEAKLNIALDALKQIDECGVMAGKLMKATASGALKFFDIETSAERDQKRKAEIETTDAQVEAMAASAQREVLGEDDGSEN